MPVAIIGAGELGGALAHKLATRDRIRRIQLVDSHGAVAAGKALDIQQAAPIQGFAARVTGTSALDAAIGASIVVLADSALGGTGEWQGDSGLAFLKQIAQTHRDAVLVFAGSSQRDLMERGIRELHLDPSRLVGSAPGALTAAVRAMVALELDAAPSDIALTVLGVPPEQLVVGWTEGTITGSPLEEALSPPARARVGARVRHLWPPGPQALATAAAVVCEAIGLSSRRRHDCFVALERPVGAVGRVAACPALLDTRGVAGLVLPRLSAREQVQLEAAFNA